VSKENNRRDSAFAKACSYLDYAASAKWTAHLAAFGAAVVLVAMLGVLWLFTDLMVWRGRVPDIHELTSLQKRRLARSWDDAEAKDRVALLARAKLPEALAKEPFDQLTEAAREAVWEGRAYRTLKEQVGEDAADRVFRADAKTGARVMDRSDHGVLSLVVRDEVGARLWSPVPWLASWNTWMWDGPSSDEGFRPPPYLTGLAVLAIILGLLWALLTVANREMAARATIEATTRLRRAVYHHAFRLGTLAVRAGGPTEAVGLLTRHVEALHDALFKRLTVWFREPVLCLLLLLFAFTVDPLLSLAFVLFAVVVWFVGVRVVAYFRKHTKIASDVAAERLTIIRESLMLLRLVKGFLMEPFNQARIERQLARYGHAQRVRHRGESLTRPALVLLGGACGLVLLYVGALLVLYGQLTVPGAVVLLAALLSLYRPAERWLETRKFMRRGREAAAAIMTFLDRREAVAQMVGAKFLPAVEKQVEFDRVSLRDPGGSRLLLDDVSLSIPAGQRIGIVGPDEQEKYALVSLIPRLLDPTAGEVRIDQSNLRVVTLDSLRAQIGLVMMQNLVFHDTVRNNIGCGDQSYTLPQIIEAAKVAHAHGFIQKLPQGYETPIGELGHSLTLSQQYRIALARAILREPALLIIEEPDAELDDETKALLDDTMTRILPGRTVVFLPHRISTMRACNTIHLLSRGKIVASGGHKELLATNKLYRHLHYLEFNRVDEQMGEGE
jgi:ATP-binding cassette subfamily B protein